MKVSKINLESIEYFAPMFLDYLARKTSLDNFYQSFPSLENFKKKAEGLDFSHEKRAVLEKALTRQYQGFKLTAGVSKNIKSLQEKTTFTITTGHQLNIFTGPLYFIYKIVTAIRLAEELKKNFPQYNFVPVYWMASEDHDFEEINHFHLFGKKFEWKTSQGGPVGKFDPSGISEVLKEITEKLPLFERAYTSYSTLAEATRYIVHEIFGGKGLVVVDGDDKELKNEFKEIIKEELLRNASFEKVQATTDKLSASGYKSQVNPRQINLFYIDKGLRERIVKEGGFKVLNTTLTFSESEILKMVDNNPEKFSPNVILRPLYENCVLPDLAYIGGPAEVSYWLQLKDMFDHYKISFPVVMPRNFVLYINKGNYKKLEKLKLSESDLFLEEHLLKEKFLKVIDGLFDLEKEKANLNQLFEGIKNKSSQVDKTLEGYVLAEGQKMHKILDEIEKRLKKSEEKKQETEISQLMNLKSKLFPGSVLQERHDNILNFYINDPAFIDKLFSLMDPLDFRFNIICEDE